jgi:hypothetical protein
MKATNKKSENSGILQKLMANNIRGTAKKHV